MSTELTKENTWMAPWKNRTSQYFFFLPITQWCSISDVLFTGEMGVSDFSVLKYYSLNINYSVNILNECLRILIDCSQLSKTYYNVSHISADVQRITLNASCMTISGGRTKQLDIFCCVTGFTSDFLSFIVVVLIRFFHRAIHFI